MKARTPVLVGAFAAGFGGLLAQVLVVREMLVTFHGNELSIGVILGVWLLWTGLGSLVLGWATRNVRRPQALLAVLLLVGAVAIVATIGAAAALKPFLLRGEAALGQVIPFRTLLASALVLLGPLCLTNGLLFPTACRATGTPGGTGRVYLLEAAGAATGGMLHCFVLVWAIDPLTTVLLVALAWCGVAGWVGWPGRAGLGVAAVLAAACVVALTAGVPVRLRGRIARASWPGVSHVATDDSRYGRVTVVRPEGTDSQASLYHNSALHVTYPDPPVAEAVAHVPLLEHAAPRRVLLLGGTFSGAVEEVLKHPSVERVTCVELDPLAVESVRRHFPPGSAGVLDDGRVRLVLGDARAFLKRTGERFDVIICAAGPPATAQANRLYTQEFFAEASRALAPAGVLAFRAEGGHNYIADENRRMLSCLRRTLLDVFPSVVVLPGAQCTFLTSSDEGALTSDLYTLNDRLLERGVEALHMEAFFVDASSEPLQEELARALELPARVNRDLAPRCYYFEAQRWSRRQRTRQSPFALGRLLEWLDLRPLAAPLVLVALLALASAAVPLCRRHPADGAVAFTVCATGFIEMSVEFAVLLGFQVVCGYVYHYVGILVSSFMFGLALGAWVSGRMEASWRRLRWVQAAICGYPLVLLGFLLAARGVALPPGVWAVVFTFVAGLAGFVGGLQFPMAVSLHSRGSSAAGALYGLDLFGSCLGALAVSSVIVPTFGLPSLCAMLAGLGILGLLGLLAGK